MEQFQDIHKKHIGVAARRNYEIGAADMLILKHTPLARPVHIGVAAVEKFRKTRQQGVKMAGAYYVYVTVI